MTKTASSLIAGLAALLLAGACRTQPGPEPVTAVPAAPPPEATAPTPEQVTALPPR